MLTDVGSRKGNVGLKNAVLFTFLFLYPSKPPLEEEASSPSLLRSKKKTLLVGFT